MEHYFSKAIKIKYFSMNEDAIAEMESLSGKYKGLLGHLKDAEVAAKSLYQPLKGLLSQNEQTKVHNEILFPF